MDVIDAAAKSFYAHHDFQPLPDDERRLVLMLSTAANALGVERP